MSDRRVARELRVEGQAPMHSRAQARRGREGGKRARAGGREASKPRSPPARRWQHGAASGATAVGEATELLVGDKESPSAARWSRKAGRDEEKMP